MDNPCNTPANLFVSSLDSVDLSSLDHGLIDRGHRLTDLDIESAIKTVRKYEDQGFDIGIPSVDSISTGYGVVYLYSRLLEHGN